MVETITADKVWEQYNQIMNFLRESISIIGKKLLPDNTLAYSYYFQDNFIENIVLIDTDTIVGIENDKNNIMLLCKSFDDENFFSIDITDILMEDLLNILEYLEKIEI